MNHRLACIDVGTNTVLLLIIESSPIGSRVITDKQRIIRIGEGLQQSKIISEKAMHRLIKSLNEYKTIINQHHVKATFAVGTSAFRDAKNAHEVVKRVKQLTNIHIEILSGETEALLTFKGTLFQHSPSEKPICVIDIGGGSTEIIIGDKSSIYEKESLNLGSVRLTERCFSRLPVEESEIYSGEKIIQNLLDTVTPSLKKIKYKTYGVAGTVTSLAQLSSGTPYFDPNLIQNIVLTQKEVKAWKNFMMKSSLNKIIDKGIPKERANILPAGCLILYQLMSMLHIKSIVASIYGLRYGVIEEKINMMY